MNLACKSAILNRGVSHLIFPDEVQNLKVGDAKASGPQGRITPLEITPPRESLDNAVELLREVACSGLDKRECCAMLRAVKYRLTILSG